MMRFLSGICLLLVLFTATGCGGSGGNSSLGIVRSPFAGHWRGTWSDSGNSQSGTIDATISITGNMTGSITSATQTGVTSGSVDNAGNAALTYSYPGITYTAHGTVAINGSGHLVGNLNEFRGSTQVGISSINLVRQ